MKAFIPWAAAAVAAIALTACNGSTNNNPSGPTPGPPCPTPAGSQTVLVYPAPNQTLPQNSFAGYMVIGTTNPYNGNNWGLAFSDQANPQGVISTTGFRPAHTIPSPNQPPSFANPKYQRAGFGPIQFSTGQTVTVYLNDISSNCAPVQIGQFNT